MQSSATGRSRHSWSQRDSRISVFEPLQNPQVSLWRLPLFGLKSGLAPNLPEAESADAYPDAQMRREKNLIALSILPSLARRLAVGPLT
jgi:hypothetical protein